MKLVTTKFKSGGLHEKHAVATWNLGTISAFAFRHKGGKKNCVEMAGYWLGEQLSDSEEGFC